MEIKDGKVVNKYFKDGKGVDVPEDYGFYQKAMNFMYNSPMDKDTVEAIKKAGIEKDVNKYNSEVYNKIGSADYFTKPNHKTKERSRYEIHVCIRYSRFCLLL